MGSRLDKKNAPFIDSDSLTLTVDTGMYVVDISIDMNVKPDSTIQKFYIDYLKSATYSPLTMLSDKIAVVSSKKIYRRIKDLYDLYCLTQLFTFDIADVRKMLNTKHKDIELNNMLLESNFADLDHA